MFRSELFIEERPFTIDSIRISLSDSVGVNTTIGVKIHYDKGTTSKTLNTINNTNYTNSEKIIHYKDQEIEEAVSTGFQAQHDFFLEFTLTGSDKNQILLPVEIKTTPLDD